MMQPQTKLGLQTKQQLFKQIQSHREELENWQNRLIDRYPPPFYSSVDLRDSGHKITPVDHNLFPAGFNNLCPEDIRTSAAIVQSHIKNLFNKKGQMIPQRILILPEAHTHNPYYVENLYYLMQILSDAGFQARLGWYQISQEDDPPPISLQSQTGKILTAHPISITEGILKIQGFTPDLILLNNDFSIGYPRSLDSVKQPFLPSYQLGWHSRKKSEHFTYYNLLAKEFASIIGIDPWIITIDTESVGPVHFNKGQGVEPTAQIADQMLKRIATEYQKRGIDKKPFVFIKNNSGTYGIGIMVIHHADELSHINRRTKNKMSVGKNHQTIHSLIVQEGIPTATLVDRLAAEPVIYLIHQELIGGFLRTHTARGTEENLNSPGMVFKKLCMSDLRQPWIDHQRSQEPLLELVYGSIARIAALATGMELAVHYRLQPEVGLEPISKPIP